MRLIDADSISLKDIPMDMGGLVYIEDVLLKIEELPTVDAVPVVRCEDCVYRKADIMCDGISICTKFNTVHKDGFWCKGGERRTDGK